MIAMFDVSVTVRTSEVYIAPRTHATVTQFGRLLRILDPLFSSICSTIDRIVVHVLYIIIHILSLSYSGRPSIYCHLTILLNLFMKWPNRDRVGNSFSSLARSL